MTVLELIERLGDVDGNLIVCGEDYEQGAYEVESVEVDDYRGQRKVILR